MIPGYIKRIPLLLVASAVVFLPSSCIDHDVLNLSDSLQINSRYSLPIGLWVYNINDYLNSLGTNPATSFDSLYFENVLYPADAKGYSFASSDTFSFNLIRKPSDKVKSIEFVILVSNGYPTDVAAQVYFLSGTTQVSTDSIFGTGPVNIEPAKTNSEGLVTEASTNLFSVTMPSEFIQKLSTITGIAIKGKVNTTRPDIHWVKFFRNYEINLHIGSRIELLYNLNDL